MKSFLSREKKVTVKVVKPEEKILTEKEKEKLEKAKIKKHQQQMRSDINGWQTKWKYLMGQTKAINKFKKSYGLNDIEHTNYGFKANIYAPTALHLDGLETLKPFIETAFSCEFVYKICYDDTKQVYAAASFINPQMVRCNAIPYSPVKVEAYQFYAGVDVTGSPVIFDMNIAPHILLAGQQRRGKNGALDHALVAWINSCSKEEIQLYLFQCAKKDLSKYEHCKQVRCYIEGDLEQMAAVMDYILDEMSRRGNLFAPMVAKAEGNDNIFHYNNLHKLNKLPYIYIIIDEFIELMPDDLDDKDTKALKATILRKLQSIGQWGGSYGCNYIICHQKPEAKLCPTFVKNMSTTRICFGFEDEVCCQIVLGSGLMKMAHKLPPRKAYYTDSETNGYLYTTNIKGAIKPNIEKSIEVGHRTVFDDLAKMGITFDKLKEEEKAAPKETGKEDISYEQQLKEKEKDLEEREKKFREEVKKLRAEQHKESFEKVDPNIQKDLDLLVEENIKKIPGFVEWKPPVKTGKEKIE